MRANDKGISMEKIREKLLELEEAAKRGRLHKNQTSFY